MESILEVCLPLLNLRERPSERIALFGHVCQGRSELSDDRGENLRIKALWTLGEAGVGNIRCVGQRIDLELPLEFKAQVNRRRPVSCFFVQLLQAFARRRVVNRHGREWLGVVVASERNIVVDEPAVQHRAVRNFESAEVKQKAVTK